MQPMSYCPQCGNPVPAAVSGPVVCQRCGTVIQPPVQPPMQPAGPIMPPVIPGDYPTTIADPYANPASSPTPPALPAVNVPPAYMPPAGPGYPYPNTPAAPATPPMTPPMTPVMPPQPQPDPGGYSPYPGQPMPGPGMLGMPGAPTPYPSPYPGMGMPQQPQRQNNPVLIGIIVALVVILVAGGVAFALSRSNSPTANGTPTATTASTATTAATATSSSSGNLTTFTDPNNFYTIGVPSGWTQTDRSSGNTTEELFQDPQSGAVAEVAYISGQQDPQTSDDQFLGGVGTITNKQGPTSVTNAGETWAEETGDTTISGQSEHVDVLATNHGGKVVIAAFLAPADSFDTVSSNDFVPMFASFQFNS